MDVEPGFKTEEDSKGGIQWFTMDTKVCFSNISFKTREKNGKIVSTNGRSVIVRFSFEEVEFLR